MRVFPAKQEHPKGPCRDPECFRAFCRGFQLGWDECYPIAWAEGYAAKICPGDSE